MSQISIDFNNRGPRGTVRGSLRRAGDVAVGDAVILVDDDEGLRFDATVEEIDITSGRVLYCVQWEPASSHAPVWAGPEIVRIRTYGARPKLSVDNSRFFEGTTGSTIAPEPEPEPLSA